MKDSSVVRTILFNILVILTLVFIYLLFFPKKSYVKEKLDNELNPLIDETFNTNINSLKIAGETYFEENENTKITVQELIDESLIAELKDSNGNTCSNSSFVEKTDSKMTIHLDCEDKSDEVIIKYSDEKFLCIYQYEKKIEPTYTDWSNWSNWDTQEIKKDDLTNVETKIEEELDGTRTETGTREVSIEAIKDTKISCKAGYEIYKDICRMKLELLKIAATYSNETKSYSCPSNRENLEFELNGNICYIYGVNYEEQELIETYNCPIEYKLSGTKCIKTEEYQYEVENYKKVTYYRYQTRKLEPEKIDVKWSTPDDKELLNAEYNMVGKLTCEF